MTAPAPPSGGRPLVLRNVTIVDTRDGALAPGLDVRIAGGVIREIATADPDTVTAAAATAAAATGARTPTSSSSTPTRSSTRPA